MNNSEPDTDTETMECSWSYRMWPIEGGYISASTPGDAAESLLACLVDDIRHEPTAEMRCDSASCMKHDRHWVPIDAHLNRPVTTEGTDPMPGHLFGAPNTDSDTSTIESIDGLCRAQFRHCSAVGETTYLTFEDAIAKGMAEDDHPHDRLSLRCIGAEPCGHPKDFVSVDEFIESCLAEGMDP